MTPLQLFCIVLIIIAVIQISRDKQRRDEMNNAREELGAIICERCSEKEECGGYGRSRDGKCTYRENFAQAILDTGFVRMEDVEIDKERLKLVPAVSRILLLFEKTNTIMGAREMFDILIQQICQAKGIIRVKEGK